MTAVGKDGRALGVPAAPAPSFRELFVMHRAPNDPRFDEAEVEAWVRSRCSEPSAAQPARTEVA